MRANSLISFFTAPAEHATADCPCGSGRTFEARRTAMRQSLGLASIIATMVVCPRSRITFACVGARNIMSETKAQQWQFNFKPHAGSAVVWCAYHALHPARSRRMQLVSQPANENIATKWEYPTTKARSPRPVPWCLPRHLHAAGSLCHDSMHRAHGLALLTTTFRLAGWIKLCQHVCSLADHNPFSRSPVHTPWNAAWSAAPSTLDITRVRGTSD
jgi:hypothetical protein